MDKFLRSKKNNSINSLFAHTITAFIFIIIIFTIIAFSITGCSADNSQDFPEYSGYINDFTCTLSKDWILKTEDLARSLEEETSCEIAVAVIDELGNYTIEDYAAKLFSKWGIGKKDKDSGILLLVSIKDRQLRIEVGYGLEAVITDLSAKYIIDEIIVPRFKDEDYNSGIYNGIVAIANLIYLDLNKNQVPYSENYTSQSESNSGSSIFIILIVILANFLPWAAIGIFFGSISLRQYLKNHRCPECRKIALVVKTKILIPQTYISSGRANITKYCKNCNYSEESTITLPLLYKTSYYSGSSSGSGGSFSSGSSGFHSSGSSHSFGGGSSGGGGASGRW